MRTRETACVDCRAAFSANAMRQVMRESGRLRLYNRILANRLPLVELARGAAREFLNQENCTSE